MPGRLPRYPSARAPRVRIARVDAFDLAAALAIVAVLAIALATFRDYSISNDEEVQHRYGELVLGYYASGLADRTVFTYKNLYLYGGLFDTVAILIGRILPFDIFVIRHLLCALIGVAGIAATWATARLIAGPRAGLIAAVSLAVCGPWFGTMFNHTKDIPFAAAMMGATYFLLRGTRDLPQPRRRDLLGFGLTLGAALGLRALGLLIVFYALVAIALRLPRPIFSIAAARSFFDAVLRFAPAFALAYLIMIAAWPWAMLDPLNPVRALFAFAHFHYPIKTLLAGETYMMANVPWWYVPTYLAIKLPLIVLFGAALAIMLATGLLRPAAGFEQRARGTWLVALVAFFPVTLEVLSHGPAFSGMRHFSFVVPPLAALAGIGFDACIVWLQARHRALAAVAFAAVTAGLIWPASVLVRLHPYEYLFFNPLVGGLAGASTRYDTDYWVNSMREMVVELEALLDREPRSQSPKRYFVAVCGERLAFDHEAGARNRLQWATDDDPADFFIAPTHQGCDAAIDGKVIATIERLGVPIGVIKDRRHLTESDVARRLK